MRSSSAVFAFALVPLGAAQTFLDSVERVHTELAALAQEVAAARQAGPRLGPYIAPAWKADVQQLFGVSSLGTGVGTYLYDREGRRWRSTATANITLFHAGGERWVQDQLSADVGTYGQNMTTGEGPNAVCRALPTRYSDPFVLLHFARRQGMSSVGGEPCELWAGGVAAYNASACVGSDGVPRAFNMTTGVAYKAASSMHYVFSNPVVGPLDDAEFAPSDACASCYPAPPCRQSGVAELELFRVHGAQEPPSLENRNLGDALGDMAFFCDIAGFDESQLVTKWSVEANTSWGQYAYCIYAAHKNLCFGHTGKHVGREGALSLGKGTMGGQCSANDDVGSWYSFPAEGQCPEGAALGSGGCTWKATVARTISAGCVLEERGLKEAFGVERGHAPMARSAAIIHAALETADPARGGCPDARPPRPVRPTTVVV